MDAATLRLVLEENPGTRIVYPEENFEAFPKIARLSRDCVISEKIDGTNAQISISPDGTVRAGSRNRWLTIDSDNFGFARWVRSNEEKLKTILGPGRHFGEWWGQGIGRKYDLKEKRFSLFNVHRWVPVEHLFRESGLSLHTVPVLYKGVFNTDVVDAALERLRTFGSVASPGFKKPEGLIVYHTAAKVMFKKTLENDEQPKGLTLEVSNA